jgi:L-seryl-tRNA(Ser) seleniumtransferase
MTTSPNERELRALPRTDRVLDHVLLESVCKRFGRKLAREWVRQSLENARNAVRAGERAASEEEIVQRVSQRAATWTASRSRRVINATGIVLHTNLGRAPLASAALEALAAEGAGYVALEVDLETGARGGRGAFVESGLASIAGAEAALVVNNNAAAVLLALSALVGRRAVVVSRGELVEIGGGFRVPEVLACSGARLVEIGTTNRTRASDYANAIDADGDIAAILRVHPGNFRQTGFVERPELPALVALARARKIPIIEDLGGGALVDLSAHGLSGDPLVSASVAAGADVVTFSTDKILGGPQGGVLVGKSEAIAKARRDPLARALRMGRLPLVALEATVAMYLAGTHDAIPALRMVKTSLDDLRARAHAWAAQVSAQLPAQLSETTAGAPAARVEVVDVTSLTGGGTYAAEGIPSVGLRIVVDDPDAFASSLRAAPDPVMARIEDDAVLCDARTILPEEEERFVRTLSWALLAARSGTF